MKKKTKPAHRNPIVLPARMRHAGPMQDRRMKRSGEAELWETDLKEEFLTQEIEVLEAKEIEFTDKNPEDQEILEKKEIISNENSSRICNSDQGNSDSKT